MTPFPLRRTFLKIALALSILPVPGLAPAFAVSIYSDVRGK